MFLRKIALPDIVISDIMMPIMDGKTLYAECRSNSRYVSVPFLFLTGIQDVFEKINSLESGAIDYVSKFSFHAREFRYKVINLLSVRRNIEKRYTDQMGEFLKNHQLQFLPNESEEDDEEKNLVLKLSSFRLSNMEIKIAVFLCSTNLNRNEIANKLCRSIETVNTHIKSIYKKTGCKKRKDLEEKTKLRK